MRERELLALLEDAAAAVAWPADEHAGAVTAAALARIRRDPGRARRWLGPAAAATGAALALALPAAAGLPGVPGIRIVRAAGEVPDATVDQLSLGRPIPVPSTAPRPVGVGRPDAAFEGWPPGGTTLVWLPTEALPEVLDTGVGLLLTTFPRPLDEELLEKQVFAGASIEPTSVGGAAAWFVSGPGHVVGDVDGNELRLAGSALVWTEGGTTYRLESALDLEAALELAESVDGRR